MFFTIDDASRRRAKTPHELTMVNLIVFNLLVCAALLAGSMARADSVIASYKWLAITAPLAISLALIGYTWLRAARAASHMPWFEKVHWRLAASRYRLLLLAYLVCAAILTIAPLAGKDQTHMESRIRDLPPAMQEMERRKLASQDMGGAVWARIGVVPLLLAIMVGIMLESGSIYQAGRGEVPDALTARFPPPPDLVGTERTG